MGKRDIFENKEFGMVALLQRGEPEDAAITFVFLLDGVEINRETGQISSDPSARTGKAATCKFTAPEVDPKKEHQVLTYYVEVDASGTRVDNDDEIYIWPKAAKVKVVHEGGDEAYSEFPIKLMQGGEQQGASIKTAKEGEVGVAEIPLTKKLPFTLKGKHPYEITNTEEVGEALRDLKLSGKLNFEAQFVTPKSLNTNGGKVPKQWVNQETDSNGQDFKGNTITIQVGVKGDRSEDGVTIAEPIGKEGITVFVKTKFLGNDGTVAKKSARTLPKTAILAGKSVDGDPTEVTERLEYTAKVDLKLDGGVGEFDVCLGNAGGDQCEISIGSTDACSDDKVTFTNWRKLYYELTYPDFMAADLYDGQNKAGEAAKDVHDDIKSKAKIRLAATFVEFDLLKSKSIPKADLGDAVMSGDYVKDAGRDRYTPSGPLKWYAPDPYTVTDDTRVLHFMLCDRIFKYKKETPAEFETLTEKTIDFTGISGYLFEKVFDTGYPFSLPDSADLPWDAIIDNPNVYKPEMEDLGAGPTTEDAVNGKVILKDTTGKVGDVTLDFPNPTVGHRETDLSDSQKSDITNFVTQIFTAVKTAKEYGYRFNISVHAEAGNTRKQDRFNNVKSALEEAVTPLKPFHPGLDDDGNARSGEMSRDWFTFPDYKTLKLTLKEGDDPDGKPYPGEFVGGESPNSCPIDIGYKIKTHGASNGSARGSRILYCHKKDISGAASSTFCHELAHAMGMTITTNKSEPAPGLTAMTVDDVGGTYYSNRLPDVDDGHRPIHVGSHCAHGVSNANILLPKFGSTRGTCILFGSGGSADNRPSFCPSCRDHIRARNLEDLHSSWLGRAEECY
ncbi:MAG: hypothetical protein OCC49_08280 [Fibrobacterales bacterium]